MGDTVTVKLTVDDGRLDNPFGTRIQDDDRDPDDLDKRLQGGVPLARHHIVPCNRLIQFWNTVIRLEYNKPKSPLRGDLVALVSVLSVQSRCYEDLSYLAADFDSIDAFAANFRDGYRHGDGAQSPDGRDDLVRLFEWLPGNLFIGPTGGRRYDDPHDGFEGTCALVVGRDAFHHRDKANKLLTRYLADPANLQKTGRNFLKLLRSALVPPTGLWALKAANWQRQGKQSAACRFGIHGAAAHSSAAAALPGDDPVTQITINNRTLDLEIWYQEDGWTRTRGSAQDIPIGDLLNYLAQNWTGSDLPKGLADLTLSNLTLEVLTGPDGSEWTFTLAAQTQLGDVTPELLVDIRRSTLGDGGPQEATVTVSAAVGVDIGDAGYLWFDGEIAHTSGGGYTVSAAWNADEDETVSPADLAGPLGIDLTGLPSALQPVLTSAALRFDTGTGTLVLAVSTEHTRCVLAAVRTGASGYAWAAALEAVVTAKASDLPLVGRLIPAEDDIQLDGATVSVCARQLTHDQLATLNEAIAATERDAATLPRFPDPDAGLDEGAALSVPYEIGGVAQTPLVAAFPTSSSSPTPRGPATTSAGPTAWVRLDRTLGPLTVTRLGLSYQDGTAWVLVDASFTASGLQVGADGLGLGLLIDADIFEVRTRLDGLGVAFDSPPVELAGALVVRQDPPAPYDLQVEGGVIIKTPPVTISALGGYSHQSHGFASMFVLGGLSLSGEGFGPPPFRVKGLVAGFGYNSDLKLPAPDAVDSFPLVTLVNGDQSDTTPLELLERLDQDGWVSPRAGEVWGVLGLRFTTFELVDSTALAVVEFGNDFTIALLGVTTASFPPEGFAFARIRIDLEALYQSSQGLLALTATLTPQSYLIDPACRLTGGLALRLWLGSSGHDGDAVLTIGGYHPAYQRPAWYPDVPRLGYGWSVSDAVSIRGEAYAALTPSAIMAGASLKVNFHAGPVRAWLTAYLDALVQWAPLYFRVDIGVDVGVSIDLWLFTITVELGVDVHLWGPPVGGEAVFHVLWFHIAIPFGSDGQCAPPPLNWAQFLSRLPEPAQVVRVNALQGLLPLGPAATGTADPAGADWAVSAHGFAFTVSSAVPASALFVADTSVTGAEQLLNIRPMARAGLTSQQVLTVRRGEETVDIRTDGWLVEPVTTDVPKALWGEPVDGAPPLPEGGNDVVPGQLTGLKVTVPPAVLSERELTATEQALSVEDLPDGPLPIADDAPVGPTPHAWQAGDPSVVGIVTAEITSDAVTAARTELTTVLAALGVGAGYDDPLTGFQSMAANDLVAEPLLVSAPSAA